jgi:hypothetical protein
LLQDKLHGGTSPKACLWEKFPDVIVSIVASVKFPKKNSLTPKFVNIRILDYFFENFLANMLANSVKKFDFHSFFFR